ncbi:peptidase inhibitor family I36 protein [Phytohabitans sp. LJ34]|uniref:peptidase inhibitor family I36 protein n=1 Tax=Phytohabitans sp. LJ34 TaxID=3452217 RepID=UPI003F8B8AF1
MKRAVAAVFAAAAMSALSLGVAGAPALADCPANRFCLYESAGYNGDQFTYAPGTSCTNLGSGINNDANAMRNYRSHRVKMWDIPGCAGATTYTAQGASYDSDFGNNGFSNKASSLKRI